MSIDWNAVLNAALTAVIVTLAIEYLAKPRLEVRKERLQHVARTRRELIASIVDLSLAAAFLVEEIPKDLRPELRDALRTERRRRYENMRELTQTLFDNAGKYGAAYMGPPQALLIDYLLCIQGTVLSMRTQAQKAKIVKDLSTPMVTMLAPGGIWRLPAVVRAIDEVRRLIAATQEGAFSEDTEQPQTPAEV